MSSRLALLAALVLPIVACAAPASDGEAAVSGEQDQVGARSYVERRLASPIPVPTNTPIGRSVDAVVAELAQGLRQLEPRVGSGATTTYWVDAEGREVFHREVSERSDIVRVGYRGPHEYKTVYADHGRLHADPNVADEPKDGRIDNVDGEGLGVFRRLEDNNHDGKIDLAIEPAPADTDLSVYGPDIRLSVGGTIANRIFEDRDHDGRFEIESLTAKASTGSWFLIGR